MKLIKKIKNVMLTLGIAGLGLSFVPSTTHAMNLAHARNYFLVPAPYRSLALGGDVVTVAKSGGNYTTINQAVNSVHDSITNPVTILIMPGTYVESVQLIGRHINLVGKDKNATIIKTYSNDYHHPPVDLSVGSNLYNLTLFSDGNAQTPPKGVNGLRSYAVHFDLAGRGYNMYDPKYQGMSVIQDCKLYALYNSAAGIGMDNYQALILNNDIMESNQTSALYAHSYIAKGARNQRLLVENSYIGSNNFATVVLQDANWYTYGARDTKDTVFTFVNNNIWTNRGLKYSVTGYNPLAPGMLTGYVKLGEGSRGNTVPELNYR